jgi:hypothetical protein
MDEHRGADVGAVLQELHDAVVVEVAVTDMVADLHPGMA